MKPSQKKEQLLFIGFGDIAQRLSTEISAANYQMTGFKRQPLANPSVDIRLGNCGDYDDLYHLFETRFDVIVITLTPSEMTEAGYRQSYIETSQHILAALAKRQQQPRLIIFVSSTSVYGQQAGEWVDEDSITVPDSFSGKTLLEAEQLYQRSGLNHCIVRFSGIYGPGRRRLIEQVVSGKGTAAKPVLYSNRIFAEDCAGFLHHLINSQKTKPIASLYLATDSEPVPLHDVKNWIAAEMKLPTDHLQNYTSGRSLRSSKRCSNKRLLASGYSLRYPGFKDGYRQLIDDGTDIK